MRELNTWGFYRSDIGNYMHRWIFKHPWGMIRIHHILRSDAGRDYHDHPFDFVSILLTGGYLELMPTGDRYHPQFSVVFKNSEDLHRLVLQKPVWTLVFTGNIKKVWGFQTRIGWIPYYNYPKEA